MVVLGNRLPAAAKPGAPKPLNLPSKQSENGNGACPATAAAPLVALPIPRSSPPAGHTDGVTGEPTGGEGGAPAPKDPNESAWGVDLAADAAAQRELAERERGRARVRRAERRRRRRRARLRGQPVGGGARADRARGELGGGGAEALEKPRRGVVAEGAIRGGRL